MLRTCSRLARPSLQPWRTATWHSLRGPRKFSSVPALLKKRGPSLVVEARPESQIKAGRAKHRHEAEKGEARDAGENSEDGSSLPPQVSRANGDSQAVAAATLEGGVVHGSERQSAAADKEPKVLHEHGLLGRGSSHGAPETERPQHTWADPKVVLQRKRHAKREKSPAKDTQAELTSADIKSAKVVSAGVGPANTPADSHVSRGMQASEATGDPPKKAASRDGTQSLLIKVAPAEINSAASKSPEIELPRSPAFVQDTGEATREATAKPTESPALSAATGEYSGAAVSKNKRQKEKSPRSAGAKFAEIKSAETQALGQHVGEDTGETMVKTADMKSVESPVPSQATEENLKKAQFKKQKGKRNPTSVEKTLAEAKPAGVRPAESPALGQDADKALGGATGEASVPPKTSSQQIAGDLPLTDSSIPADEKKEKKKTRKPVEKRDDSNQRPTSSQMPTKTDTEDASAKSNSAEDLERHGAGIESSAGPTTPETDRTPKKPPKTGDSTGPIARDRTTKPAADDGAKNGTPCDSRAGRPKETKAARSPPPSRKEEAGPSKVSEKTTAAKPPRESQVKIANAREASQERSSSGPPDLKEKTAASKEAKTVSKVSPKTMGKTQELIRETLIHPDAKDIFDRFLLLHEANGGVGTQLLKTFLSGDDLVVAGDANLQRYVRQTYGVLAAHDIATTLSSFSASGAMARAMRKLAGTSTLIICHDQQDFIASCATVRKTIGDLAKKEQAKLALVPYASDSRFEDFKPTRNKIAKRGRLLITMIQAVKFMTNDQQTADLLRYTRTVIFHGADRMSWERSQEIMNWILSVNEGQRVRWLICAARISLGVKRLISTVFPEGHRITSFQGTVPNTIVRKALPPSVETTTTPPEEPAAATTRGLQAAIEELAPPEGPAIIPEPRLPPVREFIWMGRGSAKAKVKRAREARVTKWVKGGER